MRYFHFLSVLPGPLIQWIQVYQEIFVSTNLVFEGWEGSIFSDANAAAFVIILIYCVVIGTPPIQNRVAGSLWILTPLLIIAIGLAVWVRSVASGATEEEAIRLWRDTYQYSASFAVLTLFPVFVAAALIFLIGPGGDPPKD